jgi:hypothetical protein
VYGIAVADLGLQPSEVRQMTLGEIYAVMWARKRHEEGKDDINAQMYAELQELKRRRTK